MNDHKFFSESKSPTAPSIKGKRRIKTLYLRKPVRFYNWNQPIRHFESYTLTVIPHKQLFNTMLNLTMNLCLPLSFIHKAIRLEDKYNFA